jgi:hypothetical protein
MGKKKENEQTATPSTAPHNGEGEAAISGGVKIVVRSAFTDRYDHKTEYRPGDVLEFDGERARDVVGRGLAEYATPQSDDKTPALSGGSGTDGDSTSDNKSQKQKTNGDETETAK